MYIYAFIIFSSLLNFFAGGNGQIVDNSQKNNCGFVNGECAYTVNLVTPGTCPKTEQTTPTSGNGSEVFETISKLQALFVDQSQFLQKIVSLLESKHTDDMKKMRVKIQEIVSTLSSLHSRVNKNENSLASLSNLTKSQEAFRAGVAQVKQVASALQVEVNKLRLDNRNLNTALSSVKTALSTEKSARETMEKLLTQPSCADWKKHGFNDGRFLLDVDGPGGVPPFYVFCKMSSDPPVAVIHHDKEARGHVIGHEQSTFKVDVKYELSSEQILGILSKSSNCKQYLKWDCKGALLWHGRNSQGIMVQAGWWVSRTGQKMTHWGGGPAKGKGCACAVTSSCVPSHSNLCNCDKNDPTWREDSGYLTDKSTLPVSQLVFGDTGQTGEEGYYTLGPLECVSN